MFEPFGPASREALAHLLFESQSIGVVFADPDGRVFDANRFFLDLLGYTFQEATDRPRFWIEISPPEYLVLDERAISECDTFGKSAPFEKELFRKDGTRAAVRIEGCRVRENVYLALVTDLTSIRQAEEHMRENEERLMLSLDASKTGVYDWDLKTNRVVWNRYHEILMGYTPGQAQRSLHDFSSRVHPDDLGALFDQIRRSIRDKTRYHHFFRVIWPSGEVRWIEGWGRAFYDPRTDTPDRMCGTVVDVTERKQFEGELHRAIRMREDTLATVSHDLRNPLTAISMNASLIERASKCRTLTDASRMIQKIVGTMDRLIEDLLVSARIESGYLRLQPQKVLVKNLVRDVTEMLAGAAADKKVAIHVKERCPNDFIYCDLQKIVRAFSNLLGNAIKFSSENSAVTVSAVRDGDRVIFSVTDQGPGISKEETSYLFDRYWQSKKTVRQGFGAGSGLGLYISKGIIDASGGRIWVETEQGKGSTFRFSIPVAKESSQESDERLAA